MGPLLSVSVLGAVSGSVAGRDIRIKNRKSSAVLAYVALSQGLRETRERLVGLFWSESEEEKARGSLRQTLRELRTAFAEVGYQGLRTDKLAVGFERASIDVDLWAVIRDAEAQHAPALLLNTPLLADTLLEGFDDIDPSFRVWLLAKRRTIHDRLLRALEDGLRNAETDPRIRSKIAEAILNLDATHEESCRYLIRQKALTGDFGGALRVYKTLWDVLDADYDTEPSGLTQQLIVGVKTGTLQPVAGAATSVRGDGKADDGNGREFGPPVRQPATSGKRASRIELSVAAVVMNGVQGDKVHLVQGFRQHLIACLVRFREWYVTDVPTQIGAHAANTPPVSARYAIDMTAYQSGAVLNLVLTLRETGSNLYIWSDRFELKVEIWFEMQQRIVRRLAVALNVHLSTERLVRLAAEPDVSLEIYDRWLRGQAMLAPFSSANRRRAADIFAEIIREAPDFSPAYSSLVQINNGDHIAFPGSFRSRSMERQTLELARLAVQLDPMDSRAHLCLAWSQIMAKHYDAAEAPIRLACDLNENDPWTLISAAMVAAFCADFELARDLAAQALDLSPLPNPMHWGYQGAILFLMGDDEGSLEAFALAGEAPSVLLGWAAAALFHLGRRGEAQEYAQRFLAQIRRNWFGAGAPTDESITQWLLHLYPIRRRQDWERLRDGLRGAGATVGGMDHHHW